MISPTLHINGAESVRQGTAARVRNPILGSAARYARCHGVLMTQLEGGRAP